MKKLFTFLCAIVASNSLSAQIPNPGFESWDATAGYNRPVSWDSPDSATNTFSIYPCEQGAPGAVGSFYLKLTSKTVLTFVAPGVAVSGRINFTKFAPQSGFAYSSRPANLTGSWQYTPSGADQGHVMVFLSKWNSGTSTRDTVSFTDHALVGSVTSWTTFSIPLTYQSGATPDSAIILLSSSGATPVAGSSLWVDDLAFSGTATTGLNNIPVTSASSIYPNPATGAATISYNSVSGNEVAISISDMNGRSIKTLNQSVNAGISKVSLDISGYAAGIYVVKITDGENTTMQKLIVE